MRHCSATLIDQSGAMTANDVTNARRRRGATRRQKRAERARAKALSPLRMLLRLAGLPGLMVAVALSVYVRTSPYDPELAMRHLIARAGCDRARSVGLAPALRGNPGYHARNDRDGDGVACEIWHGSKGQTTSAETKAQTRFVGGAKFIRP